MSSPRQPRRRDRAALDQALFAAGRDLCLLPAPSWHVEPDLPAEPIDAIWPGIGELLDLLPPRGARLAVPFLPPPPPPPPPAPAPPMVVVTPPADTVEALLPGAMVEVCLPPLADFLDAVDDPPAAAVVEPPVSVPEAIAPPPAANCPAVEPPAVEPPAVEPVRIDPARPPLRLVALTSLPVQRGSSELLTPAHLCVIGAESSFLVDLVLLEPPAAGTLLRDGFALGSGDVFTQEDIDHGRIAYRHENAGALADQFTFMTAEGDIPATVFAVAVVHVVRAPDLLGPGRPVDLCGGCPVRDFLAGTVRLADPDAEPGLAVVAVAGGGTWQRSADGVVWRDLVEVRHVAAVLLAPGDRLRFVARPGWTGTARLSYRAWDRRLGEAGAVVDLAPRHATGGTTPFSRQMESVTATVAPPPPPPGREVVPWGTELTVQELFGAGVAVVRLEGLGTWQYALAGGVGWTDFGSVYHGRARLLRRGDRVRFLPRPGAAGRVALTARPWDEAAAAGGTTADLAAHRATGEGTAFSEAVCTRTWRLTGEGGGCP